MFDILSQPGSGAILLAILLVITIVYSCYKKKNPKQEEVVKENKVASPLDLDDEDATVACLIAAIECRNETHKNVQVISVKEIN